MTSPPLRARRVHIAGSCGPTAPREQLEAVHRIVCRTTALMLDAGATFVSAIGPEPRRYDGVSTVFYWDCLEEVARWASEHRDEAHDRAPVAKVIATERAVATIPQDRAGLWQDLLASNVIAFESLPPGWRSAALVRIRQARYGNLMIAISGAVGTRHLAELYGERGNPVVPLPFDLGSSRGEDAPGAFALSREARADATRFFVLADGDATAALLALSPTLEADAFAGRLVDLASRLAPPRAFCIRLMNPTTEDFTQVEGFFRSVVEPVLEDLGYSTFDLTTDKPASMFVNVEIFSKLHRCALAVCDFTGLRNNVFMEGGYALGHALPTVLTARHGVELPFDADALATHRWSPDDHPDDARKRFGDDVRAALVRRPLID